MVYAFCGLNSKLLHQNLIRNSKKLKLIARGGIGYDNVDLKFAQSRKIIVTNTPNIAAQSVSELTLSFLTLYLRDICRYNYEIKNKIWKPRIHPTAPEMNIGIIGFGNIGKNFFKFIKHMNFKNIYINDLKKNKKIEKKKI